MSQKKRETNGTGAGFVVEMVVPKPSQICCVVEDWGQSRFLEGYPSHIQVRQVAVPEGLAMVACCLVCGAREEIIADLRPMMAKRGPGATAHVDDFDFLRPSREWLAAHDSCQRGLPPLSMAGQKFVHDRLRAAAAVLGEEPLLPANWLLLQDGAIGGLPLEELTLPLSSTERRQRILARQFGFRELMRRGQLAVDASLVVLDILADAKTPLPPALASVVSPGDRGLLLLLATSAGARSGWVPVAGLGAVPGPVIWAPEGSSVWVDGLFGERKTVVPAGAPPTTGC